MSARLARDEGGAIMLIGLFMGVFLTGLMFMMMGVADAAAHRERLQDGSDAGVSAAAAVYARGLNLMVQYDRVLEDSMAADAAIQFVIDAHYPACWDVERDQVRSECLSAQNRARGLAESASHSLRGTASGLRARARDAVDHTSALLDSRHSHGRDTLRVFLLTAPDIELREDAHEAELATRVQEWLEANVDRWATELIVPIAGFTTADIGSGFGMRFHPTLHIYRMHEGVDFGAPEGTPVLAAADGVVESASYDGCGGNILSIAHGGGLSTRYLHLSRYADGVLPGRRVRQGDVVAFSGNTGSCTTGAHLHFEVRVGGAPVDPMDYLGDGAPVRITRDDVLAAVRHTRTAWDSRGIAWVDLDLDVEHRQVRVAAVRGLDSLATSAAGVTFGAFGASTGGLDAVRDMGRVAWAQAEFAGNTRTPTWGFHLARFVPDDDTRGAGSACAAAGGGDNCAGIDAVIARLGGASTK